MECDPPVLAEMLGEAVNLKQHNPWFGCGSAWDGLKLGVARVSILSVSTPRVFVPIERSPVAIPVDRVTGETGGKRGGGYIACLPDGIKNMAEHDEWCRRGVRFLLYTVV